jgi:ABC-2 type transport system ATP-binding protein
VEEKVLQIIDLVKTYTGLRPVQAVRGISFEVAKGEIFGLLGPNGAGKTTTVGMATTRVIPTSGKILVDNIDAIKDPQNAKLRMGVVTQFNTLDRSLNVRQNLYFHCKYFGYSSKAAKARADELLELFQLTDKVKSKPIDLSGGLAQRVQLARAIAHYPKLLFLDEPTAGLDPQSRLALWEVVKILRGQGVTVILTTHYMEEADELCDRVAIVDHGKILQMDTPENLKQSLGATTFLDLKFFDMVTEKISELESMSEVIEVEKLTDRFRISLKDAQSVTPVIEKAISMGLKDVSIIEPTLESVFIRLTGRELRD